MVLLFRGVWGSNHMLFCLVFRCFLFTKVWARVMRFSVGSSMMSWHELLVELGSFLSIIVNSVFVELVH